MLTIVQALLQAHVPAGESEAGSLRRIRELLATASAPFSREHYAPGHLTASAIVVDEARAHTLLIFHSRLQMWLQPGGHFEPGESDPSVAAAREALEETGLVCRWPGEKPLLLDVDVHPIPARKSEPAHFHFDLRMLVIADYGEAKAGEGVSAARWVEREEFAAMELDPGLKRALGKVWG